MSQQEERGYEFGDGVPLGEVPAGTTLFVSGSSLGPAEDLALALVLAGTEREDEGTLVVSPAKAQNKLLAECGRLFPSMDASRVGLIDCTGQGPGDPGFQGEVAELSSPQDLTGIGMRFSSLHDGLRKGGITRIRTALLSVSTLLMYTELRTLFRFLHTFSGRINATGGLGVFVVDEGTQDERTGNVLGQLADGRVDVREAEDGNATGELRVRGLADQPAEWTPFALGE